MKRLVELNCSSSATLATEICERQSIALQNNAKRTMTDGLARSVKLKKNAEVSITSADCHTQGTKHVADLRDSADLRSCGLRTSSLMSGAVVLRHNAFRLISIPVGLQGVFSGTVLETSIRKGCSIAGQKFTEVRV